MTFSFRNWAGTARAHGSTLHLPASEAEVVDLVTAAGRRGERLKVIGAGHSWSDIACPPGAAVRLDHLRGIVSIDRRALTITVDGGTRIHELHAALAAEGLALPVLGSIAQQTIAGAIATGTHGSAPRIGNLSSLVTSLRLVTGDGRVVDADDAGLLPAARVALGALGIVTRVTLRCVPAFMLEELAEPMAFDDAVHAIPALVRSEPYVKLWWLPHTDWVQVFRSRPITGAATTLRPWQRWIDDAIVNRWVFRGALAAMCAAPALTPRLANVIRRGYFRRGRRVGPSDGILTIAMPPLHEETEYALPVNRAGEALRATRELIERERLHVNFVVELRFVAGDDGWLSPAHGRDTCCLGAYMARADGTDRYFAGFEARMLAMGGRPHWGKQFGAVAADLAPRYPRFADFVALRRELDPRGTFGNAFLDRVLGRVLSRPTA